MRFVLLGGILRRPWERARWFDRAESRRAVGTQAALRRSEQQKPRERQHQSRTDGSRFQPAEAVAFATAAVVAAERSDSSAGGKRPASARPRRRPVSAKPALTAANPNATAGEARRKRGEWRENGRPTSAPLRRSVWVSDAITHATYPRTYWMLCLWVAVVPVTWSQICLRVITLSTLTAVPCDNTQVPAATTIPPSPTSVKPKNKKDPQPTSPERTRLQQLQARSALLQQQSVEQATDKELGSLVLQQEESLESLAPWGGLPESPGSRNSSTGWRGVVP